MIDTATFRDSKFHGLVEFYNEVGQLQAKGTFTMNERCGEWFEGGKTVTYPPPVPPAAPSPPAPAPWHPATPSYTARFCVSGEVP